MNETQARIESDSGAARILYVEDDLSVQRIGVRILRRAGYSVTVASSAEEAISIANADGAATDLVVADINMPGKSGTQMVQELWIQNPSLRVLFISGHLPGGALDPMLQDAAFLPKPFSRSSLERAVAEALGHARPHGS